MSATISQQTDLTKMKKHQSTFEDIYLEIVLGDSLELDGHTIPYLTLKESSKKQDFQRDQAKPGKTGGQPEHAIPHKVMRSSSIPSGCNPRTPKQVNLICGMEKRNQNKHHRQYQTRPCHGKFQPLRDLLAPHAGGGHVPCG